MRKSAESGFRSFETGDYSNEIMGLASAAGFCRVSLEIDPTNRNRYPRVSGRIGTYWDVLAGIGKYAHNRLHATEVANSNESPMVATSRVHNAARIISAP